MRILAIIIGTLLPSTVFAFSLTSAFDCTGFLYCGQNDIVSILNATFIQNLARNTLDVASIAFLYGGLRMAMSQGEEGKEEGKKALIYGALGYMLATLSYAVVKSVEAFVGRVS